MGEARSRLSAVELERAAAALTARLVALPEFQAASRAGACVAGFAATRAEIDPVLALREAEGAGARLAFPRVTPSVVGGGGGGGSGGGSGGVPSEPPARLRFHAAHPEQLRTGAFGIAEPDGLLPEIATDDIAVMLVPGLAFDPRGHRLGFGGGYYDEVLAGKTARRPRFVVGVSHDFQVVDSCPVGERDGSVDCVVTDARVIRCPSPVDRGRVDP